MTHNIFSHNSSDSHMMSETRCSSWRYVRAFSAIFGWLLALLAMFTITLCTAVGPMYRYHNPLFPNTILWFSEENFWIGIRAFAWCALTVGGLIVWGRHIRVWSQTEQLGLAEQQSTNRTSFPENNNIENNFPNKLAHNSSNNSHYHQSSEHNNNGDTVSHGITNVLTKILAWSQLHCVRPLMLALRWTVASWQHLALIIAVAWIWIPITFGSAFGFDVLAQFTEVRNFMAAHNGNPYDYHSSNVIMNVYPIAHYLWPQQPTWLTNQHNIVLTTLYGFVGYASWQLTHDYSLGLVTLSISQFAFSVFAIATAYYRVFSLGLSRCPTRMTRYWQAVILLWLLTNPMIAFSTISITKSPLFAVSFIWWFGIIFEYYVRYRTHNGTPSRYSAIALAASSFAMLISAKYGIYIIVAQCIVLLCCYRSRWKLWISALLLPTLLFSLLLTGLERTGKIIEGDPIESKALFIQSIARTVKMHPTGIPAEVRKELDPIFDVENMGRLYQQDDADPIKSSGDYNNLKSYRWKTVTRDDWKQFNKAWLRLAQLYPIDYLDATLAKTYGYFDITDKPYVSFIYYIGYPNGTKSTQALSSWNHTAREQVTDVLWDWFDTPYWGLLIHGNFYMVAALLLLCALAIQQKWFDIAMLLPILLQMGVALLAPANNFDRHLLGIAGAFGILIVWFMTTQTFHNKQTS